MTSSRPVRIGTYCPAEPESLTWARTLSLKGPESARWLDGIVAVIDGLTSEVNDACARLEAEFGVSNRIKPFAAGMEAPYVEGLLKSLQSGTTSIGLAAWKGSTVVVGCRGGSRAYVFPADRSFGEGDEVVGSGYEGRAQVSRFPLSSEDTLILLDSNMATHIQDSEIRQVGKFGFSGFFTEQDAAVWLGTLALRSGETAGVAVAHFSQPESSFSALPRVLRPSLPSLPRIAGRNPTGIAQRRVLANRGLRSVLVVLVGSAFIILGTALFRHHALSRAAPSEIKANGTGRIHPLAGSSLTRPIPTAERVPSSTRTASPTSALKGGKQFSESWKFPPLVNAPQGQVVLTLYNPGKTAVTRQVRILGAAGIKTWTESVPAGKTVGIALSAAEVRDSRGNVATLYVQSSKPLVPLRVFVGS